ncbi:putative outer membrane lipoprotein [Thermocatellispora tengchongensis]|uniref:Putative outer membrane lipoprotein n=1 Tax=Thermocatellispora tengchongensis TaxID=1073253 RepID=A0A840PQ99_9ACTN|nr:zinc ribbon domain-containing protein [Thermocatellispora tengchongensis]MBB5139930.1 putative outer membrane lipoprotein [Thermocatellispora tengchongensis]
MNWRKCPDCGAEQRADQQVCPHCGLPLHGPLAEEYWAACEALAELDGRRAELAARREHAYRRLCEERAKDPVAVAPATAEAGGGTGRRAGRSAIPFKLVTTGPAAGPDEEEPPPPPPPPPQRPAPPPNAVQNVHLLFGGALLAVTATVFTLVTWDVPILRAAVLAATAVAVLILPWPLAGRRMTAIAEVVALIGLILIPMAGVAAGEALSGTPGWPLPGGFTPGLALAAAAVTFLWAIYSMIAPVNLARPATILLAQTPLPLAALAARPTIGAFALALAATTAVDLFLWRSTRRSKATAERVVALTAGTITGVGALCAGLAASMLVIDAAHYVRLHGLPLDIGSNLRISFVLLVTGLIGAAWAFAQRRVKRHIAAALGAVAGGAALATQVAVLLPPEWTVLAYTGVAYALLAVCAKLPTPLRPGVSVAAALVLCGTGVWVLDDVVRAVILPFDWVLHPWQGATGGARADMGPGLSGWTGPPAVPFVMAALAAFCLNGRPLIRLVLADLMPRSKRKKAAARNAERQAAMPETRRRNGAIPLASRRKGTVAPAVLPVSVGSAAVSGGPARPARPASAPALKPWSLRFVRAAVPVFATFAALTLPPALGLPYAAALGVLAALAVALVVAGSVVQVRSLAMHRTVVGLGTGVTMILCAWSLADRAATLPVLVFVCLLYGVCLLLARTTAAQIVTGAGAVLAAGGVAGAAALTFGWPPTAGVLGLLAVRALSLVPMRLPHRVRLATARIRAPLAAVPVARNRQWVSIEAAALVVSYAAYARPGITAADVAMITAVIAALAGFGAWNRRGRWRTVAICEAYALAVLAPLPLAGAFFPALFGPYGWVAHAWTGAPETARAALTPGEAWQAQPLLLPVLLLAVAGAVVAAWAHRGRAAALGVARVTLPVPAVALPLALDLPYWAALAFLVLLTAGPAIWGAAGRSPAVGVALWTGTLAAAWSLAEPVATIAVLTALTITGAYCVRKARSAPGGAIAPSGLPWWRSALGGGGPRRP